MSLTPEIIQLFKRGDCDEIRGYAANLQNQCVDAEIEPVRLLYRYSPKETILHIHVELQRFTITTTRTKNKKYDCYYLAKRTDLTATEKGYLLAHLLVYGGDARIAQYKEGTKEKPFKEPVTYYDVLPKDQVAESATATLFELAKLYAKGVINDNHVNYVAMTLIDATEHVEFVPHNQKLQPHLAFIYSAAELCTEWAPTNSPQGKQIRPTLKFLANAVVRAKIDQQILAKNSTPKTNE